MSGDLRVIRVEVPGNLRVFAQIAGPIELEVAEPVTQRTLLDAFEARYPAVRGTIRDHLTGERRGYIRFFACQEDVSFESPDAPLPEAVVSGQEPFLIVGAVSGGTI